MNNDRNLEFFSSARFILNSGVECFNHCVEDFSRKQLIPIEKHCMEGCMSVKFSIYSATAQNTSPQKQ